jgi:glutathione S-transferase
MSDIILHHYPASPFAEKVRVALGIKGLSWRSVKIPMVMPKPDLMPLTGGYRKTPVMQIGADIYCDTQCILRELERRCPAPGLYIGTSEGVAWGLAQWTDKALFNTVVALIFGATGEQLPDEFIRDRGEMSGRPFDVARMKAAAPLLLDQMRAGLDWLETMVPEARPFMKGDTAGLVDLNAYFNVWFLRKQYPEADALLGAYPELCGWEARMAKIGHGTMSKLEASEALDIARDATPATESIEDPGDPSGRKPGDRLSVVPDDSGKVPVTGELVSSGPHHIALRRHDDRVGEVVVHFPRTGYRVMPARE